ncbi:MAG: hypothetical protein QM723_37080 [Myxococcaceae bacterium]
MGQLEQVVLLRQLHRDRALGREVELAAEHAHVLLDEAERAEQDEPDHQRLGATHQEAERAVEALALVVFAFEHPLQHRGHHQPHGEKDDQKRAQGGDHRSREQPDLELLRDQPAAQLAQRSGDQPGHHRRGGLRQLTGGARERAPDREQRDRDSEGEIDVHGTSGS